VLSPSREGAAYIWDASSQYRTWSSAPIAEECGSFASLEPGARFSAVSCAGRRTQIWDTQHSQLVAELPPTLSVPPAISADEEIAALVDGDVVNLYALPGGRHLRTVHHNARVTAIAFSPSGHELVSGADDGSLHVEGQRSAELERAGGAIDALTVLGDGRVVAADATGAVLVYAGSSRVSLRNPSRAQALRASKDSSRLVVVARLSSPVAPAELWDLASYTRIAELGDRSTRLLSARFSANEVLTTGNDGAVRRWRSADGALLTSYRSKVRFLADAVVLGHVLVAGGAGGSLWVWDTESGQLLWRLRAHRSHVTSMKLEGDSLVTLGDSGDLARWNFLDLAHEAPACHGGGIGCAIVAE
jgi:WD40 repeat protein